MITGRQLQGRRAVESGIGRYTNYRPGTIRVTSGYVKDAFSVPYNTLSEYKDSLGSQARHPQFSRTRVGYSYHLIVHIDLCLSQPANQGPDKT